MARVFIPTAICTGFLFFCASAQAAIQTELSIKPDGSVVARNIVVTQRAGTNYFGRMSWGESASARVVVTTSANTMITKAHGERLGKHEVNEGDVLSVEGTLSGIDGSLSIAAASIIDDSQQRESKTFSGTIAQIGFNDNSFVLIKNGTDDITVSVPATLPIKKGARTIAFNTLTNGEKVISVSGTFDYTSKTLTATALEVKENAAQFAPRNFEGILKSIDGTTLIVTVQKTDYTVYLSNQATILSKAKAKASLARFVVGDTVRFFGAVRKTDLSVIDAEVVRDLAF